VEDIIDYLQSFYGKLDKDNLFEIRVILNELLINAIKHGNMENCQKCVKINACIDEKGFAQFTFEDEGEGYKHNCLRKENQDFNETEMNCNLKETGRGMLIVNSLSDMVEINDSGNKIIILKKLIKI
jgi:serine/threonine-protein kinase RsbW